MTVTLTIPFPPSVNNLFVNRQGKGGRFRSQRYDSWLLQAGNEILRQRPKKVAGPVNLFFEFQEGFDKRPRDISNLIKAPEDLLVKHGIIQADDNSIVRSISVKWSDEIEGVRVVVQPLFGALA